MKQTLILAGTIAGAVTIAIAAIVFVVGDIESSDPLAPTWFTILAGLFCLYSSVLIAWPKRPLTKLSTTTTRIVAGLTAISGLVFLWGQYSFAHALHGSLAHGMDVTLGIAEILVAIVMFWRLPRMIAESRNANAKP